MPGIAYTLPFLLLQPSDIKMAEDCLRSLAVSDPDGILILYNQGALSNQHIELLLAKYQIRHVVIGGGQNAGIPSARQACFRYVWENLPGIDFIAEIHVDMIFPPGWSRILADWLGKNDEPMVSPGILTAFGELHPEKKGVTSLTAPEDYDSILALLPDLTADTVVEGFVHPVVHRADLLKEIGGYDTRFLSGQQGYEDDSLLLGYRYYMGIKNNWKPKAYLGTRVYHKSLAQRIYLVNMQSECNKNLEGLIRQYGIYGLRQLSLLHGKPFFDQLAADRIKESGGPDNG